MFWLLENLILMTNVLKKVFYKQGRRKRVGGGGLAKQLALSQPGGEIMPTTVIQAPPPGFSDHATTLRCAVASEE
jgi:hypothetical protein